MNGTKQQFCSAVSMHSLANCSVESVWVWVFWFCFILFLAEWMVNSFDKIAISIIDTTVQWICFQLYYFIVQFLILKAMANKLWNSVLLYYINMYICYLMFFDCIRSRLHQNDYSAKKKCWNAYSILSGCTISAYWILDKNNREIIFYFGNIEQLFHPKSKYSEQDAERMCIF